MRQPFPALTPWHGFVTGFALLHLLLVTCGALHIRLFQGESAVNTWIRGYAHWTGAGSRFSFFAPGVSPAVRVAFDVERPDGERVKDDFQFDNSALNVRVYAMLLRFGLNDGQDKMARAWAASMFGRHADARSVTVRMEVLEVPTMEAHREGAPLVWTETYRAVFEHRRSTPSDARAVAP
ncbi:hypothetical protein G4177_05340 [Corallococcus sp. ZKHCc1 1396]|uniref:Uncharacterized protein n=1 Tax=Corallococcus soli TaxID=2710757 RepID=A0ABR9PI82_9BACT|nr:hypothetical protein [Corallococcus soli]MBE4747604.1 hypothetical protein [Corallococcus soli]